MGSVEVLETGVVAQRLASLRLAPRWDDKALCLWPLLPGQPEPIPSTPQHRLLAQALEDGLVGLRARPRRSEVRVENRGHQPLLVMAGEPLGSTHSAWAACESLRVPPRHAVTVRVRRRPALASRPGRALRELTPLDGQLGLVAALGDRVLGIELLGDAHSFASALPNLVALQWARALEVGFGAGPVGAPRFDAPEPFLEALGRAPGRVEGEPGSRRLHLEGPEAIGQALLDGNGLLHMSARPTPSAKR